MTGTGTLREAGLCENDTIRLAHKLRGGSARTAKTSSATSRAGTRVYGIGRGKQAVYSTIRSGKRNGYETGRPAETSKARVWYPEISEVFSPPRVTAELSKRRTGALAPGIAMDIRKIADEKETL